jgi:adenylate cyclase
MRGIFPLVTPTMTSPWTEAPFAFPQYTKVILVLDVVESVRLMEEDEHDFVQRWHYFVEQARQLLPPHGGRMHKSLGDGLMLEFEDAHGCIKAAFALQKLCQVANADRSTEFRMHLRVGAHLCEFVADQYDIYGADVNLTARIATLAGPGEIVVTAGLRDRLTAGLDADIEDLGECHLKHVKEPIRAYRVGPAGHAPVVERASAMRLDLRPTIAVIPFSMRSEEPGHNMLGEALADEVIAALSRTSELHVISRLSTTVFSSRHDAIADIRHHLGASYILSGNCRTAGNQLSLFAELVDAKTGHIAWAESLKGSVNGVFAADDSVIEHMVASVSSRVMARELERARTQSLPTLEGYTLLLGAVALMHRTAFSEFDRARQMLEHLISRSRRHPVPHAWLAKWHVLRVQQGWADNPEVETQLALDCTKRALDCDQNCALALTVDGLVRTNLLKDMDKALERYESAIEVNPNESLAWLLKGTLHAFKGEGEQALRGAERALKLSPLDPLRYFYDSLASTAAMAAGQYERSIELAKRSLRANRMHTSTLRALAISQAQIGDTAAARRTVSHLLELDPLFSIATFRQRSPASSYPLGEMCIAAFRSAGVPE